MSDTVFTPSQLEAIKRRGEPVLVSAGAGSGKTSVLVARLVEYIKGGSDITDFVIITFTNAAASELRAKISTQLALEAKDAPESAHLRRQLPLCMSAKIGTIDSFCSQLLRQYSKEAGVSPDFKIISDERAVSLKSIAVDKVLGAHYSDISSLDGFESLVNSIAAGSSDISLVNLILELHGKMMSHPDPVKWVEYVMDELDKDPSNAADTIWGRELFEDARSTVSYLNSQYLALMDEMRPDKKLCSAYLPHFAEVQGCLDRLEKSFSLSWDDVSFELSRFTMPRLNSPRGTEMPDVAQKAKAVKDLCKASIDKLKNTFSSTSDKLLSELAATRAPMKALLTLALEFDEQFTKEKIRLNLLDYSDLEHCAYKMLDAHSELRSAISERYTEIMVDEYQDVSTIQDAVFTAISDGGNKLFLVGDIKQSIYRFRLADPSIFINKSAALNSIALNENFRSRKEIIDTVNMIFSKCMSVSLGDVDYDENSSLKFGAVKFEGSVPEPELFIFERTEDDDKYTYEASHVALKILDLIKEGFRFGDIAILIRSLGGINAYRDELSKHGIPVETSVGKGFFSQNDVRYAINILKTVDNPHNDISLISTLRAEGFTADDLSSIRALDKNRNMYSALKKSSSEKSAAFLQKLETWRENARWMTMDRFLPSLGLPMSADILQLVNIAANYEKEGYHGLHRFTVYLDRLSEKGLEISSVSLKGDAVHIMSIHKSKGLQFPVVFLCDADHSFNLEDSRGSVLIHPELGIGCNFTDSEKMIRYPTLAKNAISARSIKEMKSEELRLLYVALTRSEQRLYITCAPKKTKGEKKIVSRPQDANNFLSWLTFADIKTTLVPYIEEDEAPALEEHAPEISYPELPKIDYKYKSSASIPASVTATELKKLLSQDEGSFSIAPKQFRRFRKPDFAKKEGSVSGSEKGSAMHLCLQHMDLNKSATDELNRLVDENYISRHDASVVDTASIDAFLSSPLGLRMRSSEDLRREFKFLLLVNASEIFQTDADEKVLLNGIVDCWFEEDDGIVVVDYKTDRTDRTEEYTPQIRSYALALSKVTGKKVKDAYIYYLNLGYEKRIEL